MISSRFKYLDAARAVALAVIFLLSPLSIFAQAPLAGQAPEAPPYQWTRSHNYDVQHYRIEVGFDWVRKAVDGNTTVTFRPFGSDFKEIELDAGDMTIKSVKLAQGLPLKFRYDDAADKLFVTLDKAYPAGQDVAITISYSTTPKKGLVFITPNEAEPNRPYQIWTQGEAEDNHYWFPCYDYPNDKATTETIVTVEDKYQVISNGSLVNVRPDPTKKTKTWHWRMDKPFSSYLVSLVIGEYIEVRDMYKDRPISSYVYRDMADEARVSFAKTAPMAAFFSDKIGYEYPYAKYAQTIARDFSGGMENITATTLTDTLIHDERAHLDVASNTDRIIAHELVHSWFGDMLTCRDWGELWLNESFATYFANLWTEHDKGKDDFLYAVHANQQAYFQVWSQGVRRPIVTKRYLSPDAVFDVYAYPRGAAVLNMMRFVLGEEMFWNAIRHYVKKHQWQNVETQQLAVAVEEVTGQNLQWFFDEWLYKMGHPEFEIVSNFDGGKTLKLSVKQTQKPDEKRPWYSSPEFFIMPVDIAITTASGEKVHRVWIDKREKEFTFEVDSRPLIINFDRGNYLIKQVKFDRTDEERAYQLLHDADVMGRVRAAIELKTSRAEMAAKALSEAARQDKFWGVRLESVRSLADFKSETSRAALLEAVKDKESSVRRAAIQNLAAFKDPRLAGLFINIINNDPSYFAVAEAAKALGQSGAPQAYDVLSNLVTKDSWQDTIRGGALSGLSALNDPRARDIGLKYAAPGNSVDARAAAFQLLGQSGKGDDRIFETLFAASKESSFQIRFAVVQALAALKDARSVPVLEAMAKADDLPPFARQFIMTVINQLKNASKQEETKD